MKIYGISAYKSYITQWYLELKIGEWELYISNLKHFRFFLIILSENEQDKFMELNLYLKSEVGMLNVE